MISQTELTNYLAQHLKPELFEDYAPNGLQIDGTERIQRIAFSVSASMESLEKMSHWKPDTLIVHHGVFWKHQGARTLTGAYGKKIKFMIQNQMNLYGYHLPLDAQLEFGNAASLALELDLDSITPFGAYKKQFLGVKANFKKPITALEFKELLEKKLQHTVTLASHDENALIKNIGIITGGANNEWVQAMDQKLDAFLTGEISEYNWHDAREAGIHYFAGGHHATEKFGILSLMKKIKADFPQIEVAFFDSENPA